MLASRLLASLPGIITLGMTLLIFASITLRYCFDIVIIGADEIVAMLIPLLVMLTISSLITNNQHINIDLVVNKLSPKHVELAFVFHQICHLLVGLTFFYSGLAMVIFSWRYNIFSPGELGMPDWVVQLSIPLGGLLMTFVSLKKLASESKKILRGRS